MVLKSAISYEKSIKIYLNYILKIYKNIIYIFFISEHIFNINCY